MQLVKLQVIPSSPYRSGQTSKRHVFPVTLKSTAVFVLVMTTAMQVEALMPLEEHVLAKHAVPASEVWQVLHWVCLLGGLLGSGCTGWMSLQRPLGRGMYQRKARLLQDQNFHLLQTFVPQPVWKNP